MQTHPFRTYIAKCIIKLPILMFDACAIPVAWIMAYWLRYNLHPFPQSLRHIGYVLIVVWIAQWISYSYCRVYKGLWRYVSLNDVMRIVQSIGLGVMLATPVLYGLSLLSYIPRSVLPLYAMILGVILCGGRVLVRIYLDKRERGTTLQTGKRIFIIGAGSAGEGLVRDLKRQGMYIPIGFIDDNPKKRGVEVHGVPVLGACSDLRELVGRHKIDLIFIAIASLRSAAMRRIVAYCEATGLPFRTLPSLYDLVDGRVEVNALRPVGIEDLLGRDQVILEWDKISGHIVDKTIVVTGAGGSIGSELCRQILSLQPKSLILIDHAEYALYEIEQELSARKTNVHLIFALMSVLDEMALKELFFTHKPDIVLHAAAYKHVPLLEGQIYAAIQNNVLGTACVANVSIAAQVSQFVLISSDKAVNPTNIMGVSKRLAEIYCQNCNTRDSHLNTHTAFVTVRFGNVLGSQGSVLPLFQKQLQTGGPLTDTLPGSS